MRRRSSSKLINNFGVFIFCLILLSCTKAEITFIGYHLSANELDFSNSTEAQNITLTLIVNSPNPIDQHDGYLQRSDGKLLFNGYTKPNKAIGDISLEIEYQIFAWGVDGKYKISYISFKSEEGDRLSLNQDIFFTVKGTRESGPPTIDSYDYPKSVELPFYLETIFHVTSDSPIQEILITVNDPDNYLLGEGCEEINYDGLPVKYGFQLEKSYPAGKYSFRYSVKNQALLKSEEIVFVVDVTKPNSQSLSAIL